MGFKNIVDMHAHTEHSFDGHYSVDEMIKSSIEKGIKIVAFTDHVEMDLFYQNKFDKTADLAFPDILRAKEQYKDQIEVCVGIEMGEPTYDVAESEKLMASKDYDFVIGSIHNLRNTPDFCELDYNKDNVYPLLDDYFREMKELAAWAKFDTFAHLTYPLRYIVGEHHIDVDMTRYQKDIDEIFSLLAEKDKPLEINTSGLRQPIGRTMPDESLVRRFKEMGGKYITVGSDSHYTEHMGAGIEQGMQIAKNCGFDSVLIFRHIQPVEIPIE